MKAIINWSYPINFENYSKHKLVQTNGIYQITRLFGKKESLIYIGKAFQQTFQQRLADHQNNWINNYKGLKRVRFGIISLVNEGNRFVEPYQNHHYEDIESAIIFETNPVYNTKKVNGYSFQDIFFIQNSGNHGLLPKSIDMRTHIQTT